jgi:hypothetical protein
MMTRDQRYIWAAGLSLALLALWSMPVVAQTPIDGMFTGFLTSLPLWGQVLVGFGGCALAVGLLFLMHAGAQVIIMVVIGFTVLYIIGLATSGQLYAWMSGGAIVVGR